MTTSEDGRHEIKPVLYINDQVLWARADVTGTGGLMGRSWWAKWTIIPAGRDWQADKVVWVPMPVGVACAVFPSWCWAGGAYHR